MNQYQTGGAFADVDRAAAPDACVAFLDTVSGLTSKAHLALGLIAPDPRPTPATGRIVREHKLLGLTSEYSQAA
jgi:hypothetical protein